MVKIAPSILSADYAKLAEQIHQAMQGGADMFHIDVMDGHFVPNITVGPVIVMAVRRCTDLPLDAHLMIEHPNKLVKSFSDAGADYITVHVEAKHDVKKTLKSIKNLGKRPGIVINPPTPLKKAIPYLSKVDILLVMTVNPGFAGQKFMPKVLSKIKRAKDYITKEGLKCELEVDGGINVETAGQVASAGADILVAGSAIFGGRVIKRVKALRESAEG